MGFYDAFKDVLNVAQKPSHISARIWCEKCRIEFNGVELI